MADSDRRRTIYYAMEAARTAHAPAEAPNNPPPVDPATQPHTDGTAKPATPSTFDHLKHRKARK